MGRVLAKYDVGKWKRGRSLGGGNSVNLLLKTSGGLRVFKRYLWSLDSTEQEHSIVAELTQQRFPTPSLVTNLEGKTYTVDGDRHYGLYEYFAGYSIDYFLLSERKKRRMVALAGSALGRFHHLLTDFAPGGNKVNGFKPERDRLWRDAAWHVDIVDQYLAAPLHGQEHEELYTFVSEISARVKELLYETGRYFAEDRVDLPVTLIHGDFAPHNVFYKGARDICVLDLGDACVNLRALDLARSLTSFARLSRYDMEPCLVDSFLTGYREHVKPYRSELTAVAGLLQWRYLCSIVWRLRAILKGGASVPTRLLPNRQTWAAVQWLEANGHRWSEMLR
jgi:Ser/Thr protein kinase RdoA (MazF antagonist)